MQDLLQILRVLTAFNPSEVSLGQKQSGGFRSSGRSAALGEAPAAESLPAGVRWIDSRRPHLRSCCGWSFGHSRAPPILRRAFGNPERLDSSQRGVPCSLSLRERARVRGKAA